MCLSLPRFGEKRLKFVGFVLVREFNHVLIHFVGPSCPTNEKDEEPRDFLVKIKKARTRFRRQFWTVSVFWIPALRLRFHRKIHALRLLHSSASIYNRIM